MIQNEILTLCCLSFNTNTVSIILIKTKCSYYRFQQIQRYFRSGSMFTGQYQNMYLNVQIWV